MSVKENQEFVFVLTEYEYDSYSYSGISPSSTHIHRTRQGAEAHAAELGLQAVEYCNDPSKHATIGQEELLP